MMLQALLDGGFGGEGALAIVEAPAAVGKWVGEFVDDVQKGVVWMHGE